MASVLFLLFLPVLIYFVLYSSKTVVSDYDKIRPDASIVSISHKKVKYGRDRNIKTIVTFSDGVEYHTHKTKSEPRFGYMQLSVDDEVLEEIKEKAIKAHRKLAAKHPYDPTANPLFKSGEITLPEDILSEFSNYPSEFIKVVCNWIIRWRNEHDATSQYSTLDYLRALESCGKDRRKENALQICQSIYDNKMPIEKVSIDHMMKQLGEVLNCTNKEDLTKLEDAVIIGLEGFRFYEMWTSEKYR